jgi:uncharacterized protein
MYLISDNAPKRQPHEQAHHRNCGEREGVSHRGCGAPLAGGFPARRLVSDRNEARLRNRYLADIKVKISFISANFKIRTVILETRPPHYLRCEGTGEDASVASTLKQTSEIFLTERPGVETQLRVKAKAEVFGRLGSFGLTVMKTKADRMWEEFNANVAAVLRQSPDIEDDEISARRPHDEAAQDFLRSPSAAASASAASLSATKPAKSKWWQRFVGPSQAGASDTARDLRLPSDIYVEFRCGDAVIKVLWPGGAHAEAATWLKSMTEKPRWSEPKPTPSDR